MDKADTLCSKLPLDKINQKLGGKLDVNSKKVRLFFGAGILAVIVVIVVVLIALFSSPSLTDDELAKAKTAAGRWKISDITNIEYADKGKMMDKEVLIFHAEGVENGKTVPISILVIRNGDNGLVDVMPGHKNNGK